MKNFNHIINSYSQEETELCRILKECGSDKCSNWHNYSPLYHTLFNDIKNDEINIIECGIYAGASIRAWKKYFPIANIYACDVNVDYFINDERVKSYYCNQDDSSSIQNLWKNNFENVEFDIIIDDGKHEYSANINFLINSIHKLKKGGIFIVEDLTNSTENMFRQELFNLKSGYNLSQIEVVNIPNSNNNLDNCILLIER